MIKNFLIVLIINMKLSIIVPVFNEEKTITAVLEKLRKLQLCDSIKKEIVIIDDGSTDTTPLKIKEFIQLAKDKNIIFFPQIKNRGKGSAVKIGIKKATGNYIIIQDADLEYNPEQINILLEYKLKNNVQVVYGSRLNRLPHFDKEERRAQFFIHYIGNRFLSLLTSILYLQWITDMETCYKLFPKEAFHTIYLSSMGFELEPEITAKLAIAGYKIYEVPIVAIPRGYEDGKKLHTIRDGLKALGVLLKHRFFS